MQSLCAGWRVKDVAVHIPVDEMFTELGYVRMFAVLTRFGFSAHRLNNWWVKRNRDRPIGSIIEAYCGPFRPGGVLRRVGPEVALRGPVIHHQDMRRPLGLPRVVPEERLRATLDVILSRQGNANLGAFQAAQGISLRATDIDWSWGHGPEVLGPAESIMMAVAGRPNALGELSGPGLQTLARGTQRSGATSHVIDTALSAFRRQ